MIEHTYLATYCKTTKIQHLSEYLRFFFSSAITIFPQRTDGKHDYRIWNPQMLSYAGYRLADGTVIGDPQNVEFTDVICLAYSCAPILT